MGKLCWYLVLRRNPEWKWQDAIDGVRATSIAEALEQAKRRNPVKLFDEFAVERCQTDSKRRYAEQLREQRDQEVRELRQWLGGS